MRIEDGQRVVLKELIQDRTTINPLGCWIWHGARSKSGYGNIGRCGKTMAAHRVAYRIWNGDIPDGMCVIHVCDDRACCNPAHLYLGTQKENIRDMFARGRNAKFFSNIPFGERVGGSKLTEWDVRFIRHWIANGFQGEVVAAEFGVTGANVSQIYKLKTWRHVGG